VVANSRPKIATNINDNNIIKSVYCRLVVHTDAIIDTRAQKMV